MPRRQRDTIRSNTYRFFVDPSALDGGKARLFDPELGHQLADVLRLGRGDRIILLDGEGWQYTVSLETVDRRGTVNGAIEAREAAGGEPRINLTIYLPLIRTERFEWALQKGVELGASDIRSDDLRPQYRHRSRRTQTDPLAPDHSRGCRAVAPRQTATPYTGDPVRRSLRPMGFVRSGAASVGRNRCDAPCACPAHPATAHAADVARALQRTGGRIDRR
jgi:hypothetical protein